MVARDESGRELVAALATAKGHFLYESGHHGDVWLDLNALFVDAAAVRRWASELARCAKDERAEVVCGPMIGGALLAQQIAAELGVDFVFVEQFTDDEGNVRYRVPQSLREKVRGRRALLVDDVVNAGSAWELTLEDLRELGAQLVAFATLATMGDAARAIASRHQAPLFALAAIERGMWAPGRCPLCKAGVPLSFGLVRR